MEVNPKDLYKDYINKILDLDSLIEHLSSIIENSKNIHVRILSIQTIGQLELNSNIILAKSQDTLFHLLENLLISDSNKFIRNEAAIVLNKLFKRRSIPPMKWALFHDESPKCLNTIHRSLMDIIDVLDNSEEKESHSILKNLVLNIEDKDFVTIQDNISDFFTKHNYVNILSNYFTLIFLKKVYWRLKYKIQDGVVDELDFSFKVLSKLPSALKYLKSLRKLTLKYNQIFQLPAWIGNFTLLEQLNLNINNITKLPDSISKLRHLEELSLWKNELETLPESLGKLKSVKKLNLRLNQLKRLPYSIGNLYSLKELDLHDNRLESIPDSIAHLKSLEILNLSWNLLEDLPQSFYNLTTLRILDLGRNELKSISQSISRLKSLEILNLSENKLSTLPQAIGELNSLKVLNLSRNLLKSIPASIGSLPLIEELYIEDNQIEELPSDLLELEKAGLKIIL
jgi:Leucine-rich repeat (LRR) protein